MAAGSHVWRSLGDLSMKDLSEWHIFIKTFSIHLLFTEIARSSERILLPEMRRRGMCIAIQGYRRARITREGPGSSAAALAQPHAQVN